MFARFDENPAMTLRVIKETKRYGRTDARTDGRMDNVKTVYPLQTKFAGGITICMLCNFQQDQTLLWTCVACAHLRCINNHYAKFEYKGMESV